MKISKNSFVCRVAYSSIDKGNIPSSTNLCVLFWLFISSALVTTGAALVVSFVFIIIAIIGFPFATRLAYLKEDNKNTVFTHYRYWPKINGHRIYPVWPIIAILAVYNLQATKNLISLVAEVTILSTTFWIVIGCIIMVIIAFFSITSALSSVTFHFFKAYIKAKKQKICPLVEIV